MYSYRAMLDKMVNLEKCAVKPVEADHPRLYAANAMLYPFMRPLSVAFWHVQEKSSDYLISVDANL